MWISVNKRISNLVLLLYLFSPLLVSAQNTGLIRAAAKVELVADGFAFLEGPVRDKAGNLLFTDINNNRIHRLSPAGLIETLLEPSYHANGLTLDVDGSLLICEQSGQRISRLNADGSRSVVVSEYNGAPFNSPNDIWLHRNGSLYFTDPRYRYPEGEPSQAGEYVYRVDPARETVAAIITDVPKPNGIIGTEDGAHLYVASTELRKVFRYDINPDGSVGNRLEFADQGSDGMAMDERGNLYLTWAGQVSIYSPAGELLQQIAVPENPANVAFGGVDGHTLYITARTGLYALRMNVVSSRFRYSMMDRQ
ncbi:MAG: SMP-30/gluconolactonase/LRE family protein [Pseudomonadales bacterium]|nr:SMP-30/gluconolactonase/LRE family protein [Pseudomonadales bacterium]